MFCPECVVGQNKIRMISGIQDYRKYFHKESLLFLNMKIQDSAINDLTHKIIGCAMQVHRTIGNGFQELIYQRALAIEFDFQNIEYVQEMNMEIYYREVSIGKRRVDFYVENKVMVEIKAIEQLGLVHKAQAINYCEAYNIADGLLINFGSKSLDFKRVYNKKFIIPRTIDNKNQSEQD